MAFQTLLLDHHFPWAANYTTSAGTESIADGRQTICQFEAAIVFG
jgi:hypothetical protein